MFDVITIGSATKDVFLRSKEFKVFPEKKLITGKGVCFNLGSKIEVEDIFLETGGGATNTAVAFSRLGLKTAAIFKIGKDIPGLNVVRDLRNENVSTKFTIIGKKQNTGYSNIILLGTGERTVLVYRGANNLIEAKDIKFRELKTKWLYLAPLSGNSKKIIPKLISYAKKNKIKVAMNPSESLIRKMPAGILKNVDILILNREEASILTKVKYTEEDKIFRKLCRLTKGFVAMTEGKRGAVICDGYFKYRCNSPYVKVVDTLGAGDAFGSGFTAAIIKTDDIERAIYLGTMNSCSVIQQYGAKPGLLRLSDVNKCMGLLKRIKIKKTELK